MRAFNKLLIANFKLFMRDRTAVFFAFAFPILFMIIFGFVFSGDNDISYDISLVNNDGSEAGATIAHALNQVPIFKVSEDDLDSSLEELKNGNLQAVILIPEDIQLKVSQGEVADIVVYYDPARTTSSQVILSVLGEVVNQTNRYLTQEPILLQLREESIQSKDLRNIDYLVPGIIAMSALFLGLFGALPLVEWREKQVLKRFGATPIRRVTIVSSQVVYRLVLALIQTFIIIAIAYFVFSVEVIGSWLVLFGLIMLGTLTFVCIGYLAVSRAKTVEGAMPVVQLIQFPMLFLSGIFFPIDFMPDFMRPIVSAMPLTYLGDALRQTMVSATPEHSILVDTAVLAGWLVVSMALAIRLFRWE
jgi:ABC-2 type transport system permease protein